MRVVSEGKLPDISRVKDSDEFPEYHDIMDAYVAMLKVIKKNTFDLNSQQSKTEIILEHMADSVDIDIVFCKMQTIHDAFRTGIALRAFPRRHTVMEVLTVKQIHP